MPDQKFQKGDIVIIQSPAAPHWVTKQMYDSSFGKIIGQDGNLYLLDMRPEIVGEEDEVLGSYAELYGALNESTYNSFSLKKYGSWYNESQLKLKQ